MEKKIQTDKRMDMKKADTRVVRILAKDIEGDMSVYAGLTKIKGVNWTLSNAACKVLKIDSKKLIGDLDEKEVQEISVFLKKPTIPPYMLNRQADLETGEDKHLIGTDLELKNEFDVKRLKKIKCYRGLRHTVGLPMRGQRTKGNFRRNRKKGAGIKKK